MPTAKEVKKIEKVEPIAPVPEGEVKFIIQFNFLKDL